MEQPEITIAMSAIAMVLMVVVVIVQQRVARRQDALRKDLSSLWKREDHVAHRSIHHLFDDHELMRPRGGGKVDMVLDGADLPTTLGAYLEQIRAEGAEARVLILDPSSPLIAHHRLVAEGSGELQTAAEHVRSKIEAAIDEIRPLATVRLYDAMPPGNLIIVDDHVFWGGISSVPTDISLPVVSLTVDTREHLYWAFRRNFDALWKSAKPVEPPKPKALTAAAL